jgi:CBS domain-containing protein/ribosome-associated translation inhibitor RaiA
MTLIPAGSAVQYLKYGGVSRSRRTMNIADIATKDFIEADVGKRMGKIRSTFENGNPKGIIVTNDGEYEGVISEREVLQSHVEDDAKVAALIKPSRNSAAPKIDRHEDVRETARMLIESNSKVAPVFENGELWGVITDDAILEAVLENLDALTVEDVYTSDPVTLQEQDGVGKAINHLREHGISRLPILNENGYLTGVVTTHDIADFVIRENHKTTTGDRVGDTQRLLDVPIYDIMNSPVRTTTLDATAREAVGTMLNDDYAGLMVTPEDDDRVVIGVITKTDVLRALTFTEEEHMDVQITNISMLDTITREGIVESIQDVSDKYADMQVMHAHVRFNEHKEKLRGTPLVQCQIRLRTNKGQVAGTGEGYGAENAFRVALDKLERNVLELKGVTNDEEYRGQLLRKLNEL